MHTESHVVDILHVVFPNVSIVNTLKILLFLKQEVDMSLHPATRSHYCISINIRTLIIALFNALQKFCIMSKKHKNEFGGEGSTWEWP